MMEYSNTYKNEDGVEVGRQIARGFLVSERMKSLYITKAEREELERLGFDQQRCRLIERVEGGSVFICAPKIYGPIIISGTEERPGV